MNEVKKSELKMLFKLIVLLSVIIFVGAQHCPHQRFAWKHICAGCTTAQQAGNYARQTNGRRPQTGRGSSMTETVFLTGSQIAWAVNNHNMCIAGQQIPCYIFRRNGANPPAWTCRRGIGRAHHDSQGVGHFFHGEANACRLYNRPNDRC